jgi:hypothetical protein
VRKGWIEGVIVRDWLGHGKKWVRWGVSQRDYLSIKRVLELEKQGDLKICNTCKQSLANHINELQKAPLQLCKFCDTVMGIDADLCPHCKKSQH